MTQIVRLPTVVRDPETYAIIGAAMEVHRSLGLGFLEPVYQEALFLEMAIRRIPVAREVRLPIEYKGVRLSASYRVDFVCYGSVLVEVKALRKTNGIDESQVLNYLAASQLGKALLLNFGGRQLEFKRFAYDLRHLRDLRTHDPNADPR